MTLRQLSDSQWDYDCSITSMPPVYVVRNRYTDTTANGLTKAVITHIRLIGGQAERVSNEGRVIDNRKTVTNVLGQQREIGSIKRVWGSGKKGTADIHATIKGRSVKIEVKMKDQQSEHQRAYQAEVERASGIYVIVRSFADWIGEYNKIIR